MELTFTLWQDFLETRLEEASQWQMHSSHYIFTDSDVAVVDDLGQIFKNYPTFHLGLTFRNNKEQPLNSGFIAVRGTADGIRRYTNCKSVSHFLYGSICCNKTMQETEGLDFSCLFVSLKVITNHKGEFTTDLGSLAFSY